MNMPRRIKNAVQCITIHGIVYAEPIHDIFEQATDQ